LSGAGLEIKSNLYQWPLLYHSRPFTTATSLPHANPWILGFFLKKWSRFPGVRTYKLSKCPGWGQRKRANALTLGLSSSNTSAIFN